MSCRLKGFLCAAVFSRIIILTEILRRATIDSSERRDFEIGFGFVLGRTSFRLG